MAEMDFGFGAFLEKFEAAFGQRLTRLLLALIGLSVSLFCCSMIWRQGVLPAWELVSPALAGIRNWRDLLKIVWLGLGAAAGFGLASLIATSFVSWKAMRDARRIMEETREYSEKHHADIEELQGKAKAILAAALLIDESLQDNPGLAEALRRIISSRETNETN